MKLWLLCLLFPTVAIAHPGHQHADWIALIVHSPLAIVLALLCTLILGVRLFHGVISMKKNKT